MISNPKPIVQQLPCDFQTLMVYAAGSDAQVHTAYTGDLALFRLLLVTRAAMRAAEPVTAPDGMHLTSHDQHPTTHNSVFGSVRFEWHDFTTPGRAGRCPVDAELNLPVRCYADLLREWAVYGPTEESCRESKTILERILGLSRSLHALESAVVEAGEDVTTVDEQPTEPTTSPPGGTIVVEGACGHVVKDEGLHGAVGNALDPSWRGGRTRPAGGAAQWPLACLLAVGSAPTTSAVVSPVHPSTGVSRSPSAGVGCLINRRPRILVTPASIDGVQARSRASTYIWTIHVKLC